MPTERLYASGERRRTANKRARLLIALFLVCAALASLCWRLSEIPVLTITENATGRVVYRQAVAKYERFSLVYTHSVNLTPVEEVFYVDDDLKIVLDSLAFSSYGVGMPDQLERGETFRFAGGQMRVERMQRVIGSFDLFVGQVVADHRLVIRGRTVRLAQVTKPGASVRIAVRPYPLALMKGAVTHGQ